MYLAHLTSDVVFPLCPRLLWEIGRHGDIDRSVSRRRRWSRVNAQIWCSSDRWYADRDHDRRNDEDWNGYDSVRVDGVALTRAVELLHGNVLEVEGVEYRVVREADDPPRGAMANPSWGRLALRPQDAITAFGHGQITWIDTMVILTAHRAMWPHLREVFRGAAERPGASVRAAGLCGLMALSAAGGVEPGIARRAIASVGPDAELLLRMGAARALFGIDPLAATPKLLSVIREALAEGEVPVAAGECARALARSGDARAIDEVVSEARAAAADAPARKRRALAARVLGEMAKADQGQALRALRSLVHDPHESVRLAAVRSAAGSGATEALVDAVADTDDRVRSEALAALRVLPGADERILVALDASRDGSSRQSRLLDALDRLTAAS